MNQDFQILKIIECLEDVLRRPGIYLGAYIGVEQVIAFISGFDVACRTLGLSSNHTDPVYQTVINDKGWQESSTRGIYEIMRERGLDDNEIIKELITIEIEVWKKRHSQTM